MSDAIAKLAGKRPGGLTEKDMADLACVIFDEVGIEKHHPWVEDFGWVLWAVYAMIGPINEPLRTALTHAWAKDHGITLQGTNEGDQVMAAKNPVSDFVGVTTHASLDHGGEVSREEYITLFQDVIRTFMQYLDSCGIAPGAFAFWRFQVEMIQKRQGSPWTLLLDAPFTEEYRNSQGGHDADTKTRPTIVCLCGSTRFVDAFAQAHATETDAGKIVLSVGRFKPVHGWDPEKKAKLDELHLRKIDMADEVLILNVGGYIGDSTRRELEYAKENGKTIRFLEPEKERTDADTEARD